jgi:hypothetical protein
MVTDHTGEFIGLYATMAAYESAFSEYERRGAQSPKVFCAKVYGGGKEL